MSTDPNNPNPAGDPAGNDPNPNPAGDPAGDAGDPTGLPSDGGGGVALNFEITDAVKEKFITADGKLLGKYDNLEQVAEAHKNLQDKHAQYVEDVKKREGDIAAGIEGDAVVLERQNAIREVIPEFMKNNMELTPEIEQVLTEKGLDIRDVKLGAIELRDKINSAHAEVGGKENYEAMLGWASETLSDAEKKSFDADIQGSNSRFTIKGLYSEFEAAKAASDAGNPSRLRGSDTTNVGVRPYESQAEIFKDKQYLDSPAGKNDTAARAKYNTRLGITDPKMWRGY